MATSSTALMERLVDKQTIPKSKRKLQKHLRSAGLSYISRTGKLIPAKKVADELCQCPHKCDELVPMEARKRLFAHFYGLAEADFQNQFLRQNMDLRARLNVPETTGSGRPPRRITCKYLVPLMDDDGKTVEVCQKAFVSAFVITTKRVRLQREKLISSLGLNSYSSHNRSKEKDKTTIENNNNNTIIIKRTPQMPFQYGLGLPNATTCELMDVSSDSSSSEPKTTTTTTTSDACDDRQGTRRHVDNPLIPVGLLVPDGVTIAPVVATPDHDRDIAIVNNFFSNQLWKPEYIGAYS